MQKCSNCRVSLQDITREGLFLRIMRVYLHAAVLSFLFRKLQFSFQCLVDSCLVSLSSASFFAYMSFFQIGWDMLVRSFLSLSLCVSISKSKTDGGWMQLAFSECLVMSECSMASLGDVGCYNWAMMRSMPFLLSCLPTLSCMLASKSLKSKAVRSDSFWLLNELKLDRLQLLSDRFRGKHALSPYKCSYTERVSFLPYTQISSNTLLNSILLGQKRVSPSSPNCISSSLYSS